MNGFDAKIQNLGPRYAPLATLARNDEAAPLLAKRGCDADGAVFAPNARRGTVMAVQPVATAMRATRFAKPVYSGAERIRVFRDRRSGKLAIQAA